MPLPTPDQVCDVCRNLMDDLLVRDIPWEDEAGIPHQPTILALEESSLSCSLCYQVWVAAGRTLANRGGMVTYMAKKKVGDKEVSIQSAASNFSMGGLFRAMANGAMVSSSPDAIEPDLSELQWVHPGSLVSDPERYGSYIFGNWYQSPFAGDDSLKLIGLGVRLGTSSAIADALGNKPDQWFLAGSYLRFRTKYDSSVAPFVPGRIRNWDLSSTRAMGQVKSWLEICDKHHQCLQASSHDEIEPVLPTRVLCIEANNEKVVLFESQARTARYVALSHSWGKSHRLTLTKANMATLKAGIGMAEIPQTFQDAITVCRALGVQYLWVDSLCIVQDDPEDWEAEASKMSSVYMNSYLTISALHSADDTDGCFPSLTRQAKKMPFPFVSPDVVCTGRPTVANAVPFVIPKETIGGTMDSYNHAVAFSMHGKDDKKYYITNEWMPPSIESNPKRYGTFNFGTAFDPLKSEPLSSRGWVLQERLLSPRTLHYSEGQMYWECQNIVLGEDGSILTRMFPQVKTISESRQNATQISSDPAAASSQYIADEWLKLVEVFCTRKLTMEYDKLVAISGLANIVAQRSGDEYYAGLWKSNLLNGLCWKKKIFVPHHQCSDEGHEHALPDPTSSKLTSPSEYRAPSWSWASIDGEIEFEDKWLPKADAKGKAGKEMIAEVLDVSVVPLGLYKFGRIKSGFIKLKTAMGGLQITSAPIPKQAGQLHDQFHTAATMHPISGQATGNEEGADKSPTETKPRRLSKLFSRLKVSNSPSTAVAGSVAAKVLFDIEPQFPCFAAFVTNTYALVLLRNDSDGSYKRIGVASFVSKEVEKFLQSSRQSEIIIV